MAFERSEIMKKEIEKLFEDAKASKPKSNRTTMGVSVTSEEWESFQQTARSLSVSMSEYIRRLHKHAIS